MDRLFMINFETIYKHSCGDEYAITGSLNGINNKTIIYLHGLNDCFYNHEFKNLILSKGYNLVYPLLHGYDYSQETIKRRLWVPYCYTDEIESYHEELDRCFERIYQHFDENHEIYVIAHSTGGLTFSSYLAYGKYRNRVKKILLNSPWFSLESPYINEFEEFLMKYIVRPIGYFFPFLPISPIDSSSSDLFNTYIQNGIKIEEQDIKKVCNATMQTCGFIKTVTATQKKLIDDEISTEALLLCSETESDGVLETTEMIKNSMEIYNNITSIRIKDAIHNVYSSPYEARYKAYELTFKFFEV